MDNREERRKLGEELEIHFRNWLDKNNIPYWYIQQDISTFSPALKDRFLGKRPDFMILLPNFGLLLVDLKNRKINQKYGTYPIDCSDAKKYSSIQRIFNLQVWFVISNSELNYETWMWIPVSKILEEGVIKQTSSKSGEEFFAVPTGNFTQVANDDSLERLFSKL